MSEDHLMPPLIRFVLFLLALAAAILLGGKAYLGQRITDACATQLQAWARAQGMDLSMGKLQLHPWAARVAVDDCRLKRQRIGDQPSMTLTIEKASIGVDWAALLQQRLAFTSLSMVAPKLRVETIGHAGRKQVDARRTETSPSPSGTSALGDSAQSGTFKASESADRAEHGLSVQMPDELAVRIAGGEVEVLHGDILTRITGITAQSFAPSPRQRWRVEFNAKATVATVGTDQPLADLTMQASILRPPGSAPLRWEFKWVEGSRIGDGSSLSRLAGAGVRKLLEQGLDLGDYAWGGALLEPCVLRGTVEGSSLKLGEPALLRFSSFEANLLKGSWVAGDGSDSQIRWILCATPKTQSALEKALEKNGENASLGKGAIKALANDKGLLTLDLESRGPLGQLKTEMKLERALRNLLKGEGLGDLLQGLFKKLK